MVVIACGWWVVGRRRLLLVVVGGGSSVGCGALVFIAAGWLSNPDWTGKVMLGSTLYCTVSNTRRVYMSGEGETERGSDIKIVLRIHILWIGVAFCQQV